MSRFIAGTLALCIATTPAWPQEDPTALARRAALRLEAAGEALQAANGARDRIRALTQTIRAYEAGLSSMREGLRQAADRELVIREDFARDQARLADLLGTLQVMQGSPEALLLLHPDGPLGSARSGMMLADVTPALLAEVEQVRQNLETLQEIQVLQENASVQLQAGLSDIQEARSRLAKAVQARTDLPKRASLDETRMAALTRDANSLQEFADGLGRLPDNADYAPLPDFAQAEGALDLPVSGRVLRPFLEADAAGISRPGWVLQTAPQALVTAPWPITIRYRGPLLDYGNVIIIEPSEDYLIVLAGLGEIYVDRGQILPVGAPLGLMPQNDALQDSQTVATLYIEIRVGQRPVDPAIWFRANEQ